MTVDSGGRQPSTARDNIAYTPPEVRVGKVGLPAAFVPYLSCVHKMWMPPKLIQAHVLKPFSPTQLGKLDICITCFQCPRGSDIDG